jgi:hypothetical protein
LAVSKIIFSSSFELYFYNIKCINFWDSHVGKPVKRIHFIAIPCTAAAIVLAASNALRIGTAIGAS